LIADWGLGIADLRFSGRQNYLLLPDSLPAVGNLRFLKFNLLAMNKKLFALALPVFFLFSCKNEKICKYKPSPIFAAGLPHITQYNFETQGAQSLESLLLDTGVLLEIHQDVCAETRQEYRFTVKGDFSQYPDSLWLKEATRQLVFLSSFSPKQAPLKAWADVIEQNRPQMRLGEDHEVESGIFVRVDRVISPEQSTLLLVFSQK